MRGQKLYNYILIRVNEMCQIGGAEVSGRYCFRITFCFLSPLANLLRAGAFQKLQAKDNTFLSDSEHRNVHSILNLFSCIFYYEDKLFGNS